MTTSDEDRLPVLRGTIASHARSRRQMVGKGIITGCLAIIGIAMVLPFAWMISASMKPEVDVFKFPIEWIPRRFQIALNYRRVWLGDLPFIRFYVNSVKVAILTTVSSLFLGSLGAYGFAKIRFPGRDRIFLLVMLTMIIPEQITLLPRFMYFKWLGLFDTHASLVINSMFSVTVVFFFRQYIISIPNDYSDSARVDGASHFRTFTRIIAPMATPAIVTLGLLKFIWSWNDYMNPLIFLVSPRLYTIQIAIKAFGDKYGQFYSLMMAASVSAIVPLFILFLLCQRYVLGGITMTGIKG